jgi:hypothetical protein
MPVIKSIFIISTMLILALSMSIFMILLSPSEGGHFGCPFMPGSKAVCQMSPIDHVEHWRQAFISMPAEMINLMLFSTILAFSVLSLIIANSLSPPDKLGLLYLRESNEVKIFNYLISLFSRGLLHPRIYA